MDTASAQKDNMLGVTSIFVCKKAKFLSLLTAASFAGAVVECSLSRTNHLNANF